MKLSVLLRGLIDCVLLVCLSISMSACSPGNPGRQDAGKETRPDANPEASTRRIYEQELARTPPLGWNSWNIFHGDIDEEKIKGIADRMVENGMRDAGYTYLVLDDGWMADKRDSSGKLVADPNKFPRGMKALGDYIHSRGLKFGIYQDRGHSTCMKLPGSFGHEQMDMDTFAAWGVDYIKLDSCYAEINGRKSSVDFGLYKACIIRTGRPMVLSMANYTDPSWAWEDQTIGHLWRTSFDIGPHMGSVYYCADTAAGDLVIHPAFNGLWQFAGPGRWNDPDMLQVGNLPTEIENRTHFALWCIMAAPLMAGNDLRAMSDETRDILCAPEVLAVNQDPRGIQGYKVYDQDDREIYNKPLYDGTTAVLLLNKNPEPADMSVTWDMIGLAGRQPVRDLWQRRDLGRHGSFTARNLPQHGHRLLKIGSQGRPLPTAAPVPLEDYAVTQAGTTYLSDLYYIWKRGEPPQYDRNFDGEPIVLDGAVYDRGFGCKATSKLMFKLMGCADRFKAVIGLDPAYQGDETVHFRLREQDPIGPDSVLYDSGKMGRDTPARHVEVDVRGIDCLVLAIEGKQALANWADARVLVGPR